MGDPLNNRLRHHIAVMFEAKDLLTQCASTRDERGDHWQLSLTRCVTSRSRGSGLERTCRSRRCWEHSRTGFSRPLGPNNAREGLTRGARWEYRAQRRATEPGSLRFNPAMMRWNLRPSALSAVSPCDGAMTQSVPICVICGLRWRDGYSTRNPDFPMCEAHQVQRVPPGSFRRPTRYQDPDKEPGGARCSASNYFFPMARGLDDPRT